MPTSDMIERQIIKTKKQSYNLDRGLRNVWAEPRSWSISLLQEALRVREWAYTTNTPSTDAGEVEGPSRALLLLTTAKYVGELLGLGLGLVSDEARHPLAKLLSLGEVERRSRGLLQAHIADLHAAAANLRRRLLLERK